MREFCFRFHVTTSWPSSSIRISIYQFQFISPVIVMEIFPFYDWFTTVFIGFFVVSYWRSTWTLIDIWGCDQPQNATLANGDTFCYAAVALYPDEIPVRLNNARASYAIGIGCLILGVFIMWRGLWVPTKPNEKVTLTVAVIRFCAVYTLGTSELCQLSSLPPIYQIFDLSHLEFRLQQDYQPLTCGEEFGTGRTTGSCPRSP